MRPKTYDIIIRVSSLGERRASADSTMTLDDQRRRCEALIRAKGARVGEVHDAKDVSGWISVDSAKYRAAIERIRARASNGLALAYFNRGSRNEWARARFFAELEELGADIWFADHPSVDYRSREGRMLFGILGVVGQDQLLEAREKGIEFARQIVLERGVANRVPYGYRRNAERHESKLGPKIDPGRDERALVPDPETAHWVRRIFEWRAAGWRWMDIRDELEAKGAPSPRGGPWARSSVQTIVRNEAYLGVARYRRRAGHRLGPRTDEYIRNDAAHEPLVDPELWRRGQSTQSVQRTGAYAAGVAGGLLVCSSCGGRMSVGGDARHLTYDCRRQRTVRCRRRQHVMKHAADAFVADTVENLLEASREARDRGREVEALRARLAGAEAQLSAFVRLADALDAADFQEGYAGRRDARDAVAETLAAVEAETVETGALPTVEEFRVMDEDARRRVAKSVLARVEVYPREPGAQVQDRFVFVLARGARDLPLRPGSWARVAA